MLYRGPKTAGGWLQKIAICCPQEPCQNLTVPLLPTASQVSSISTIDRLRRPGVEKGQILKTDD